MEAQSIRRSPRMRFSTLAMFVIGLTMWFGVPLLWLFVGSKIKSETDSIGLAIVVMGVGALAMIIGLVRLLGRLNHRYQDDYLAQNGEDPKSTPLEPVLVFSASLALIAFGVWFMVFAGGGGPSVAPGS